MPVKNYEYVKHSAVNIVVEVYRVRILLRTAVVAGVLGFESHDLNSWWPGGYDQPPGTVERSLFLGGGHAN